jgi:hypothetical protein
MGYPHTAQNKIGMKKTRSKGKKGNPIFKIFLKREIRFLGMPPRKLFRKKITMEVILYLEIVFIFVLYFFTKIFQYER